MKLEKLLNSTAIEKVVGYIKNVEIEQITINSREVKKNCLFIAQSGGVFDGHNFLEEAVLNGAVALVVEKINVNFTNIPQILVKNTRVAVCTIASEFYQNPKNMLKFVGVSGTNGKTSTVNFIAEILRQSGKKFATVGTLGVCLGGKTISTGLTTPDPIPFHKLLAEMVKTGVEWVVMEVSAHAIYLQKIYGIEFEVGILTNITQDHLDFFRTMNNYAKTKLSWIMSGAVKNAVLNFDDNYIAKIFGLKKPSLWYGKTGNIDVFAEKIDYNPNGMQIKLSIFGNTLNVGTKITGEFNVYNILAVVSACVFMKIPIQNIKQGIKKIVPPEGRFNVINFDDKTIIVDFAHTPDGLEKVLKSARKICKNQLFCLFGCGGDRDKIKRPIMGKIGSRFADFCILTSDNPRFENPENILNDIEKGVVGDKYFKIADRRQAIKQIISMLKTGDVAIICGKGGEKYQDINGVKIPYDDFEEIQKLIKK